MAKGFDFLDALNAASQSPSSIGDGRDLPDGFPFQTARGNRVVDTSREDAIDGLTVYDYSAHRGVFLIYRPWTSCDRCATMLANGKMTLPEDDGDIVCPHTQASQYKAIQDKALAGQLILGSEQEVVQRDGTIVISLKWFETKLNYKRQRALKKKLEKEVATQTSEPTPE